MEHGQSAARRTELSEQRRKVDFDSYDVTVDELLRRVVSQRIEIAPVYQRQFRWDAARQSRLIESIFLGIPIPPLFMATNRTAGYQDKWEVVDGLQRLLSLVNFVAEPSARAAARLTGEALRLVKVEKLTTFNGVTFLDLPEDIRTALEDRPLKVVVLNDKSDLQVRFDLFERLNTGGVSLTPQEIRECVFRGEFIDLLGELAGSPDFRIVVRLPEGRWKDGTPEDFVLRFFAFHDRYLSFQHSVGDFLNDFALAASGKPQVEKRRRLFSRTFRFLAATFPNGLRSRKGATPVNLFEAVSVGAALALSDGKPIPPPADTGWTASKRLRELTTGATNSRPRVVGRIQFCRDQFLSA